MAEGIVARGSKTTIRWFQREDVDKRQAWPRHADPLLSHNDPRPMSSRERDFWFLERSASANYRMFAIDDYSGNLVGWLTLRNLDPQAKTSVLGIALDPTKMDRGYGTDALWAFLDYYFDVMGYREMLLDVAAFNRRAMRSYEKCGFRYAGQHWTDHPASLFPQVLSDRRYKEVAGYFRRSLLGIELLYYDMALDRHGWLTRKRALEGTPSEAEREVPVRRVVGR